MPLRRTCLLALTTGLLVLTGCGEPPRLTRTVARSPVETAKHPPPTVPEPDVRASLAALVQVARWATPPPTTTTTTTVPHRAAPAIVTPRSYPASFQPCDGAYPPCWRVATESGGNYGAFNPTGCGGSGCYGKWQFSGEWACKLGLPCDLATATPQQQDEAARLLWNGGAGCSNWDACR